jgi:hypothetical protein
MGERTGTSQHLSNTPDHLDFLAQSSTRYSLYRAEAGKAGLLVVLAIAGSQLRQHG